MRRRGTGLPRWARGAGLSPMRRRKAPAPQSLAALILKDDADALQARLCREPQALFEIRPDPDFFAKQWPRLLRQACQHMSHECLGVLINLRAPGMASLPLLPPRALGWLLKGKEDHLEDPASPDLSQPGFRAFLGRVSKGPIILSKEDGLRVIRMNGWRWALVVTALTPQNTPGQRETLHPELEASWSAWCAKKPHIDAVVDLIAQSLESPQVALDIRWGLEGFFDRVPANKQEGLRQDIGDALAQSSLARAVTGKNLRAMVTWARRFDKQGWGLDHPVWEQWGASVMDTLSYPPRIGIGEGIQELASVWVNVVLSRDEGVIKSLPGWGWDDRMQQTVIHSPRRGIPSLLEDNYVVNWNTYSNCLNWLDTMDRLEKRLVALGWREDDHAKWSQSIDRALGEDWMDTVDEKLDQVKDNPSLASAPSGAELREKWLSWQERRMEVSLAQAPVTLKPKVRF